MKHRNNTLALKKKSVSQSRGALADFRKKWTVENFLNYFNFLWGKNAAVFHEVVHEHLLLLF